MTSVHISLIFRVVIDMLHSLWLGWMVRRKRIWVHGFQIWRYSHLFSLITCSGALPALLLIKKNVPLEHRLSFVSPFQVVPQNPGLWWKRSRPKSAWWLLIIHNAILFYFILSFSKIPQESGPVEGLCFPKPLLPDCTLEDKRNNSALFALGPFKMRKTPFLFQWPLSTF